MTPVIKIIFHMAAFFVDSHLNLTTEKHQVVHNAQTSALTRQEYLLLLASSVRVFLFRKLYLLFTRCHLVGKCKFISWALAFNFTGKKKVELIVQ